MMLCYHGYAASQSVRSKNHLFSFNVLHMYIFVSFHFDSNVFYEQHSKSHWLCGIPWQSFYVSKFTKMTSEWHSCHPQKKISHIERPRSLLGSVWCSDRTAPSLAHHTFENSYRFMSESRFLHMMTVRLNLLWISA